MGGDCALGCVLLLRFRGYPAVMEGEFLKYLTVFFLSCFKFIFGPTLGIAYGFSVAETALLTTMGMMTSVFFLTFVGEKARNRIMGRNKPGRKIFTKRTRRFVYIWRRYGLFGVAFLTPIIFSPILGTLLMSIVGGPRKYIWSYMLFSAIFWSIIFSVLIQMGVEIFL